MQPPKGTTVIEGGIARYWIEDGLLVSVSNNRQRTVALIRENLELVKQITGGKRMPLLIFLTPSPMPDKATRQFSTEVLPEIYSAMAMVSKPGLGHFIMRLLFALKPPPIPMKSFTNEQEARGWLKPFATER